MKIDAENGLLVMSFMFIIFMLFGFAASIDSGSKQFQFVSNDTFSDLSRNLTSTITK
jgi:hypothetical protein